MKKKDLTYLIIAAGIFLVCGYVLYSQLGSGKKNASRPTEVEVVGPITAQFDQTGLADLNDPTKVKDFNTPVDLTGLNNSEPFGP